MCNAKEERTYHGRRRKKRLEFSINLFYPSSVLWNGIPDIRTFIAFAPPPPARLFLCGINLCTNVGMMGGVVVAKPAEGALIAAALTDWGV